MSEISGRIDAIVDATRGFKGYALTRWISGYTPSDDGLVNLEGSHLLVLISPGRGNPKLVRAAGTLERSGKNYRVLFSSMNLVRIQNGSRKNLVVPVESLRYDEEGIIAGIDKQIQVGPGGFKEESHKDLETLRQVEETLEAERLTVDRIPFPAVFRRFRDKEKVIPRVTGALIAKFKDLGVYDSSIPLRDLFSKYMDSVAIEGRYGYTLPFDMVGPGGLTLLDIGALNNEAYLVPLDQLDLDTPTFAISVIGSLHG